MGEDDKDQAGPVAHHRVNLLALFKGEVSHGGEDADAAEDAGHSIDHHNDGRVTEDGPVEPVIRAESDQRPEGNPDRVEHLGSGVDPDLGLQHHAPLWVEEKRESVRGAGQAAAACHENKEKKVGDGGREVDHLARGFDGPPDAEVDDDPGHDEKTKKLPANRTQVLDARCHIQDTVAESK